MEQHQAGSLGQDRAGALTAQCSQDHRTLPLRPVVGRGVRGERSSWRGVAGVAPARLARALPCLWAITGGWQPLLCRLGSDCWPLAWPPLLWDPTPPGSGSGVPGPIPVTGDVRPAPQPAPRHAQTLSKGRTASLPGSSLLSGICPGPGLPRHRVPSGDPAGGQLWPRWPPRLPWFRPHAGTG